MWDQAYTWELYDENRDLSEWGDALTVRQAALLAEESCFAAKGLLKRQVWGAERLLYITGKGFYYVSWPSPDPLPTYQPVFDHQETLLGFYVGTEALKALQTDGSRSKGLPDGSLLTMKKGYLVKHGEVLLGVCPRGQGGRPGY